jgi:large repetitive protein
MKQVAWLLGAVVLLVGAASATAAPGAPQLAFNPASGTFGPVAVGDTTAAQQFVLTNSGTVGTAMLKVSLSGDDAAQFTITANTCAATSLGPNKKCSVSVQYTPSAPGASDTAILTAESKKPAAKATVALSGSGIQPNRPPDAADVSLPMNEDQSLFGVISVLGPDGDPVSLFVNSPAAHGTLTLNSDGSFTYTPNPNFNGEDSFSYRAEDQYGASSFAAVHITVNPVNDAPVANNDTYFVNEDQTLTAPSVLPNDTDVDGDALVASQSFPTRNGNVVLNPDGSFTYTPNPNFFGIDSFGYVAIDPHNAQSFALVSIHVTEVRDAPVANDDSYSVNEDQTLTVSAPGVLANDTDVDGDALTALVVVGPAHGTLTLNPNGSFTYTPNPNYNGEDSFTYGASDWSLPSNYATVTITVNSVNDAPVANNDGPYTAHNDTPLTVSAADGVLTNDTDIDGPNPLIAEPLGFTTIAGGSVVLNLDGSFTYTAPAGYVGGDFFRYFARDGGLDGISDIATVTIDVREPT